VVTDLPASRYNIVCIDCGWLLEPLNLQACVLPEIRVKSHTKEAYLDISHILKNWFSTTSPRKPSQVLDSCHSLQSSLQYYLVTGIFVLIDRYVARRGTY
jgi:hypothetical protein